MPRVYRSPVKETTHKAPLESPYPPYQAQPAAEEAAHTEAGTPPDVAFDTPLLILRLTPLLILRLIRLLLIMFFMLIRLMLIMMTLLMLLLCLVHHLGLTRL